MLSYDKLQQRGPLDTQRDQYSKPPYRTLTHREGYYYANVNSHYFQ